MTLVSQNGRKVTHCEAFIGDGALRYLARRIILEHLGYTHCLKTVEQHYQAVTCNKFLGIYARATGLAKGCNTLEALIYRTMKDSPDKAYELVSHMYAVSRVIEESKS